MSDTENNTDKLDAKPADSTSTSAETKVDTAPYINKKHDNKDQDKSNFVMPLVLLAVSVIVIVATFYEDEYNDLVASIEQAETEAVTELISDASSGAQIESASTSSDNAGAPLADLATEASATTVAMTATNETESAADATVDATAPAADDATAKAASAEDSQTLSAATTPQDNGQEATSAESVAESDSARSDNIATAAAMGSSSESHVASDETNAVTAVSDAVDRTARHEVREAAYQERLQQRHESREQHTARMQQRREELLKQAQDRRELREQLMSKYREQRAQEYQSLKAVYVEAQQQRDNDIQKIRQIHQQLEKLRRELHQTMSKQSSGSANANQI
jgi:DNA repair exonuclease SbcCD ATPase subunit